MRPSRVFSLMMAVWPKDTLPFLFRVKLSLYIFELVPLNIIFLRAVKFNL